MRKLRKKYFKDDNLKMNLHLYQSTFTNESKVLREAYAISKTKLFSEIILVGIKDKNLLDLEQISKNIKIMRVSSLYQGNNLFIKAMSFLLWNIRIFFIFFNKKISCLSVHSLNCLPLACLLKFISKSKIIYVPHELETERNGLNNTSRKLSRIFENFLIKYVYGTIFISHSYQSWYKNKYYLLNTEVIYNCPLQINYLKSDIFRDKFNLDHKQIIFLYQGILTKGRGIYTLIDTFKTLSDKFCLVFLGYGPLEDYVIKKSLKIKNIFYHPAVKPEVLLNYTSSADYGFTFTENSSVSYDLCMPNKLFEYISVSIPVIVSNTKTVSNFVKEHDIGIVSKSFEKKDIINAINQIVNKDRDYFKNNLEKCKLEYNWLLQEKKLKNFYQKLFPQ